MKTTVLFRMIVLVAMVFAGIANTTVKAQGNNFITNEEKVDDLVVSKVIYRLDGSLYRRTGTCSIQIHPGYGSFREKDFDIIFNLFRTETTVHQFCSLAGRTGFR